MNEAIDSRQKTQVGFHRWYDMGWGYDGFASGTWKNRVQRVDVRTYKYTGGGRADAPTFPGGLLPTDPPFDEDDELKSAFKVIDPWMRQWFNSRYDQYNQLWSEVDKLSQYWVSCWKIREQINALIRT